MAMTSRVAYKNTRFRLCAALIGGPDSTFRGSGGTAFGFCSALMDVIAFIACFSPVCSGPMDMLTPAKATASASKAAGQVLTLPLCQKFFKKGLVKRR